MTEKRQLPCVALGSYRIFSDMNELKRRHFFLLFKIFLIPIRGAFQAPSRSILKMLCEIYHLYGQTFTSTSRGIRSRISFGVPLIMTYRSQYLKFLGLYVRILIMLV